MNNIAKQLFPRIKPKINPIKFTQPHCGRDICYCFNRLNLDNKEDLDFYRECYSAWLNLDKINKLKLLHPLHSNHNVMGH